MLPTITITSGDSKTRYARYSSSKNDKNIFTKGGKIGTNLSLEFGSLWADTGAFKLENINGVLEINVLGHNFPFRFIIEFWRFDDRGVLILTMFSSAQYTSIFIWILLCIYFIKYCNKFSLFK